MGTLNPNIPAPELSALMTSAAAKRSEFDHQWLTPQLLLHVFLQSESAAAFRILQQLAQQRGFKLKELQERVQTMARYARGQSANFNFVDDFGKEIPLSDEMLVVLDEGLSIAQARDELKVTSGHALAAMADSKVTTYGVLQKLGVSQAAIVALLDDVAEDGAPIIHDFVQEARDGKTHPVYQREALLRDLLGLLSVSNRRHVILVGEEGVGKRTLAYSLAQLIAEGHGPLQIRSLVQINESALLENPLAAMRTGMRRASGGILLVPGIDRFFADRLRTRFPENVSRELHKALLGNEQIILGTSTPAEYEGLAQERIIRQHSQRLDVPPATREETVAILSYHRQRLEQEYEIEVTRDALETAAALAGQYIKTIALPAAAVQLADRAAAQVRLSLQSAFGAQARATADRSLDAEDVMLTASQVTGIPLSKLGADEQDRYANMVDHLHRRIIGQEEAVLAVSRAVKIARVGLRDPQRPIGSFLFLGPSGVGKSELAKALAEFMFGTEEAMLTLDMSEYQGEGSVNRLIGAPPGYIGYGGGGQLTDHVREQPYSVILFDEVEKAHERVFDVLLQVLDEGRLTDGQGRTATFSETVIIMTSNLGARHLMTPLVGEHEKQLVMDAVHDFFRPEFLNRLDDIIFFHQLTAEQLALILELMLKTEVRLAAQQGMTIEIAPAARQWMLAQNDEPQFGARPLRRIISRHLREPLADFLLTARRQDKSVVKVDAGADGLAFQMTPMADQGSEAASPQG